MIYLNKSCFNGLYRVNSKGEFNTSYGCKEKGNLYDKNNILEVSEYLKESVNITSLDFEESLLANAKNGDFIFIDSPYAPVDGEVYDRYTKDKFSLKEHIKLSEVFKQLDERGCRCMLTNHDTDLIRDLYKDYKIDVVNVKGGLSILSSKKYRSEVIITNYDY